MRRLLTIVLLALTAATLVASPAAAAPAKGKVPSITRVMPMRVSVGHRLVILGRHFKARRKANTVIFRAPNGRTAFVKPRKASRRKLVLTVPESVARLLTVSGSRQRPTRLKLRVLAGRFSKYTPRRLSPVVTGVGRGDGGADGGGGGGAVVCDTSPDHDGDLLPNALELTVKTDPCLTDTDGDSMSDGWEFYAAKDLNIKAVPYPGERPYPNALDPSDGADATHQGGFSAYDFDGDGLTTLEEYRAWLVTGGSFDPARAGGLDLESPLGYSDGTKYSRNVTPSMPAWRGPSYGLAAPTQPFPATYNFRAGGGWRDDERDADADGLANWLESLRGPSRNDWWKGFWAAKPRQIKPWKDEVYCGLRPGHFDQVPYAVLDLADPDVDGDTLLDGEDDQDHDNYSNITEMYEVVTDLDGNGNPLWCGIDAVPTILLGGTDVPVNAMNPCVPDVNSRTCHDYIPF